MDFTGVAGPAKPEETSSKQDSSNHTDWQTPLWDRNVVIRIQLLDIRRIEKNNSDECDDLAKDHAKIGESSDTASPTVFAFKDKCVGGKEEIQKTIWSRVS